jgi:hypothetical protein
MIKTCDAAYWQFMEALKPEAAPCGRTFDDYDHSTVCPHNRLPTDAERRAALKAIADDPSTSSDLRDLINSLEPVDD